MSDPERQPLLGPSPAEQRSRRWSVGCLMVVTYLQSLSSNGIDSYVKADVRLFHPEFEKMNAAVVGGAVIIYILPVCVGLYADVIVGKYTALFFGLSLKVLGALLSFVVILRLESWPEIDPITLKVLAAAYFASVLLLVVGLWIILPLVLSFGSQQINQATDSQASLVRWVLMAMLAGLVTEYFLSHHDIYIPQNASWLQHYPQTVRHAASFILDGLSIAVFLFGKHAYNKPSPAEGRKSLKALVHIARNHITCLSSRRHYDTNDTSLCMRNTEDSMNSSTLERLRIRKAVITIPLFSAAAASFVMLLVLDQVTLTNVEFYHTDKTYRLTLIRNARFAVVLPAVPLVELIIRKCRHHLWQNNLVNQLKTLGFGILLSSLSFLTAGVVASILPHCDYLSVSVLYVLPQYIIAGLASFAIYSSGLTFCLTECPTGLSTVLLGVCISFCLLFIPLEALIAAATDFKNIVPYTDVFCYVAAAVLLAILVVIYIPVSIWYVKAGRAIDIALDEQEDSGSNNQARSTHIETQGPLARAL